MIYFHIAIISAYLFTIIIAFSKFFKLKKEIEDSEEEKIEEIREKKKEDIYNLGTAFTINPDFNLKVFCLIPIFNIFLIKEMNLIEKELKKES